jgi:ADP-heptose:LPS heptosyltransferase
LGDNLLLSCLAREIKSYNSDQHVIVETSWPELFINNPHADAVFSEKVALLYRKITYKILPETREHVIDQMIKQLPFPIMEWDRNVDLFLRKKALAAKVRGLPEHFIVTNPRGKNGHSANRKEWGYENFVALHETLTELPFVQIGDLQTPLLPEALDYRGRPILESAFIISRSATGVFLEGGLMHVANAVRKPSVIIYGGAVHPEVSGYEIHHNIHTEPECGPCFTSDKRLSVCDSMVCMKQIGVERVARAVLAMIGRTVSE